MDILTIILYFIAVIIFFVVDYFVAKEFYIASAMKGWSEKKYFWLSFFLLFVGYILVAALPDRGGRDMDSFYSDDLPDI